MTGALLLLGIMGGHGGLDTTLHLPRNGAVEIDTHLRDITLHIGSGDVVTVHGARGQLDGGTISIGEERRGRSPGTVDVTVPAWAHVDISTQGGNITLIGTPEQLRAESVSGFIHVNGATGVVELEAVAGDVVVNDFHGSKLSIDATSGTTSVTNASGVINVENVNEGVTLRGIRSTSVSAASVNGGVEFEGTLSPTGSYAFSSENDDVVLTLAADVSARMKITTMNGELRSPQIPATTTGSDDAVRPDRGRGKVKAKDKDEGEHTFTAVFGSGTARVTIEVFNGDVVVKKKP